MNSISQQAANLWDARIGRFLSDKGPSGSLGASYPCRKGNGAPIAMRIGGCKASFVMIDQEDAILIDKLNLAEISRLDHPDCRFRYGEHIKDAVNTQKSQINWALDPARQYPLLLLRPGNKSSYGCLALSHTANQITVCIPTGSYSFDALKVRQARDFINAHGLHKMWRKAADLRQTLSLGEHLQLGTYQQNKMLADHAELLKEFPLEQWLPEPNSGDHIALGESLAEKPELDLASLPNARQAYLQAIDV